MTRPPSPPPLPPPVTVNPPLSQSSAVVPVSAEEITLREPRTRRSARLGRAVAPVAASASDCQTETADLTGQDCDHYRTAARESTQGWAHFRAPPLYRNQPSDVEFHVEDRRNAPAEGGIGTIIGERQTVRTGLWVRAVLQPSAQYEILGDARALAAMAIQRRDGDGRQIWSWRIKPLVDCTRPCLALRVKLDVMARLGPNRFERVDGNTRVATVAVGVKRDIGWLRQVLIDLGDLAKTGKATAEAWIALIGVLFAFVVAMIARWRWLRGGAKGDAPK